MEKSTISTEQLADELENFVNNIRSTSYSEGSCLYWAIKDYDTLSEATKTKGTFDKEQGLVLPLDKFKELCPNFSKEVLEPADAYARNAGKLFKQPEQPQSVILFKSGTNEFSLINKNALSINISSIRKTRKTSDLLAILEHEIGHLFHDQKGEGYFPKNLAKEAEEFSADRFCNPREALRSMLSIVIENPDSLTKNIPSIAARMLAIIESMLFNDIFGQNGNWKSITIKNVPSYQFVPNDFQQSCPEIQDKVIEKIGKNGAIPPNIHKITEDGGIVRNYAELKVKAAEKAFALTGALIEKTIENGKGTPKLTPEIAEQWLNIVDREVKKFKKNLAPKFINNQKTGRDKN